MTGDGTLGTLETSNANARQLHHRAGQRLGVPTSRFRPDPAQWRELVERFFTASRCGDVTGLVTMSTADATSTADGGGKVAAARRPVVGRNRVARYLAGALSQPAAAAIRLDLAEVNGEPAMLGFIDATLAGVLFFETDGERIAALRVVSNPDKLRFVAKQLSHTAGHSGL